MPSCDVQRRKRLLRNIQFPFSRSNKYSDRSKVQLISFQPIALTNNNFQSKYLLGKLLSLSTTTQHHESNVNCVCWSNILSKNYSLFELGWKNNKIAENSSFHCCYCWAGEWIHEFWVISRHGQLLWFVSFSCVKGNRKSGSFFSVRDVTRMNKFREQIRNFIWSFFLRRLRFPRQSEKCTQRRTFSPRATIRKQKCLSDS